jgi:hypothetical protein
MGVDVLMARIADDDAPVAKAPAADEPRNPIAKQIADATPAATPAAPARVSYAQLTRQQRAAMTQEEKMAYIRADGVARQTAKAEAWRKADPSQDWSTRPAAPAPQDGMLYYYAWIGGVTSGSWRLYRAAMTQENIQKYGARAYGGTTQAKATTAVGANALTVQPKWNPTQNGWVVPTGSNIISPGMTDGTIENSGKIINSSPSNPWAFNQTLSAGSTTATGITNAPSTTAKPAPAPAPVSAAPVTPTTPATPATPATSVGAGSTPTVGIQPVTGTPSTTMPTTDTPTMSIQSSTGTTDTTSTTSAASTGVQDMSMYGGGTAAQQSASQNAIQFLIASFSDLGIGGDIANAITNLVQQGYTADTIQMIAQDPNSKDPLAIAFQQRFPANAARMKAGLPVLSPSEYLATERSYAQVLQAYGLNSNFANNKDVFTKLLTNDISPTELNSRASTAKQVIENTDPLVTQQLQSFYGLSQGDMIAHVLDPSIATPIIEKQIAVSQVGAEAARFGANINVSYGEQLAGLGITQAAAAQGFQNIASQQQALQAEASRNPVYLQAGAVGSALQAATFGTTGAVQSQQELERLKMAATNPFGGSSGVGKGSLMGDEAGIS